MLDVQAGMLLQKLSQGLTLMSGRSIQRDDHRAAHMAQQLAEKEAQTLSSGTDENSRNDRDLVSASLAMIMHRSAPLRRPCPGYVRDQEKARLVGEN